MPPLVDESPSGFTAVATSGIVDPADAGKVEFVTTNGGVIARLKSDMPAGTQAILRYNVVGTFKAGQSTGPLLVARFQDNGNSAQVIIDVKAYDWNAGNTSTVLRLDSNAFAPLSQLQTQAQSYVYDSWAWGFTQSNWSATKVYFIEVRLIKTGSGGDPRLTMLWLTHRPRPV